MKRSAGILLFRRTGNEIEVLLVHPGGPFWARKDVGAWSIPKGEYGDDEDAVHAAKRELNEETGLTVAGELLSLGEVKQGTAKRVSAWAVEGDCDAAKLRSNTFELEWPPRSGKREVFPEIDRAQWFTLVEAREKILKAQVEFLDRLAVRL